MMVLLERLWDYNEHHGTDVRIPTGMSDLRKVLSNADDKS